jgi:coenzyme F420-reducing hydrogenase gamma subunit
MAKTRIAVHKFSSCDGCQLGFLNLGENLLALGEMIDIAHFAEAGMLDESASVDIAFVEGSIATDKDRDRIEAIRKTSQYVITIGACATAGGLQALRNMADADQWHQAIYAQPSFVNSLRTSTPIAEHIKVDFELWGCPISTRQLLWTIRSLMFGATPAAESEKVCMECKRQQNVCVMVTQQIPCMGPVTKTGCGALCPQFGRDCYGCFGPANDPNSDALGKAFQGFGLLPDAIKNRFHFINSHAAAFQKAGKEWER